MLTRKHFIAMAESVAKIQDKKDKETMFRGFVELCKKENPRFDLQRFAKAAGVDLEEIGQ